jgi:hypothetical protein
MMRIRLVNPAHVLPLPGQPGIVLKGTTILDVNPMDPFWAALLRDGSVTLVPEPDHGPAPHPAKAGSANAEKEAR